MTRPNVSHPLPDHEGTCDWEDLDLPSDTLATLLAQFTEKSVELSRRIALTDAANPATDADWAYQNQTLDELEQIAMSICGFPTTTRDDLAAKIVWLKTWWRDCAPQDRELDALFASMIGSQK